MINDFTVWPNPRSTHCYKVVGEHRPWSHGVLSEFGSYKLTCDCGGLWVLWPAITEDEARFTAANHLATHETPCNERAVGVG